MQRTVQASCLVTSASNLKSYKMLKTNQALGSSLKGTPSRGFEALAEIVPEAVLFAIKQNRTVETQAPFGISTSDHSETR